MGEENKIRDTAEAVKGVVQAVPVYQDLIQPAAKKLGASLETIADALNAALLPLRGLIWWSDRVEEYLNAALADKFKHTPLEKIAKPNLAIAGPIVDAMKFVAHEPNLREMYANLLATSINADTAQNAHPAFIEFIRQMTADEARILEVIALEEIVSISLVHRIDSENNREIQIPKYEILAEKSKCEYRDLIPSYLDNLRRLGLTQHEEDGWHKLDLHPNGTASYYKNDGRSLYAPVDDPMIIAAMRQRFADELKVEEGKKDGVSIQFHILSEHVQLTSLGDQFARACIITWDTGEQY